MEIYSYIIVKENSDNLSDVVNSKIKIGYQPYGNPFFIPETDMLIPNESKIVIQAMVRYK